MIVALPVLVPLSTAVACLLAWRYRRVQRGASLAGAATLLAGSVQLLWTVSLDGVMALAVGGWPAPFGIVLVADLLAAIMTGLTGLVGLAVCSYSVISRDARPEDPGFHPLVHVLLAGVSGAFLAGDLFNMYVWFEVLLISSFVLLCLGGGRARMEGAMKYVTLNLIASALFLVGAGILYGVMGTLNLADLSVKLGQVEPPGLVTALSMLFLVAFGIKAAVFPLYFWLPASYHTPPPAVSALFAGLLTKVGVYALIRVFSLLFYREPGFTHSLILVLAALTMVSGVLGAMVQKDIRRILSFHIISQIGYMLMGLGLFSVAGMAGGIFYIIHHVVVKTNLFLISGAVRRARGTEALGDLGGLYPAAPWVSALFLVSALSLAGLPPLSGFIAKLALVRAGLSLEQYAIVAVSLGVSLLTLYSMTKIWNEAFMKPAPDPAPKSAPRKFGLELLPVGLLASVTVCIGLGGEHVFLLAEEAARQVLDPSEYVRTVLGNAP